MKQTKKIAIIKNLDDLFNSLSSSYFCLDEGMSYQDAGQAGLKTPLLLQERNSFVSFNVF